jgi:hypothetical protein
MSGMKRLAVESVGRAMRDAERYRFLGEPCEAESICRDVLDVDPDNHEARITLILSLTDQFRIDLSRVAEATTLAAQLEEPYERFYYSGLVVERVAKTQLARGGPGSDGYASGNLREAMEWYEKADAVRPSGNDDAVLRWNTCARALVRRGLAALPAEVGRIPLMSE